MLYSKHVNLVAHGPHAADNEYFCGLANIKVCKNVLIKIL